MQMPTLLPVTAANGLRLANAVVVTVAPGSTTTTKEVGHNLRGEETKMKKTEEDVLAAEVNPRTKTRKRIVEDHHRVEDHLNRMKRSTAESHLPERRIEIHAGFS